MVWSESAVCAWRARTRTRTRRLLVQRDIAAAAMRFSFLLVYILSFVCV